MSDEPRRIKHTRGCVMNRTNGTLACKCGTQEPLADVVPIRPVDDPEETP